MATDGDRRLNSWKEIGAFFGKDERTVKRWEAQRGLPVHRLPGGRRTTVYAYASELDGWLRGEGRGEVAGEMIGGANAMPGATGVEARRALLAALGVLLVVLALGVLIQHQATTRGAAVAPAAPRAAAHQPPAAAVDLYLAGMFNWEKRTPESLDLAVRKFNEAIAIDPDYAEAYVGLANCYNLLREYTMMPAAEAYPRAKEAAERAIALDDELAEAHISLAFVEFYWSRDIARARSEFQRGLQLDPKSVRAHHWFATALLHMGEFEEALREIDEARALEPQSRSILADKGLILFYAGRVEEAVRLLSELSQSEPDYLSPFAYLAVIYFAEGEYENYFAAARTAALLLKDENRLAVIEAAERGWEADGRQGMLRSVLDTQQRLHGAGAESAWALAQTFGRLGDAEMTLSYLRASIDRGEEYVMAIRIEPAFAFLHGDPAFRALVAEVGMPPL